MLNEKIKLTSIGFILSGFNIYANYLNLYWLGIGFGIIASVFYIKALKIKKE